MKVYLVTSGEYSDWRIEGIFSTPEGAEAYRAELAEHRPGRINDVDEWDVDRPRAELPGAYRVRIGDNGEVIGQAQWFMYPPTSPPVIALRFSSGAPREFWGYGLTEEHARRSAEDARRETLATEGKVVR